MQRYNVFFRSANYVEKKRSFILGSFAEKLNKSMPCAISRRLNIIFCGLGFNRAGFYRKMKGLMDISPLDFLRNYRLKRAAEMICEGSLSLNEVAEKTGFGTYSYFSVAFKKHFNVSPKDYG